MLLRVVSRDTPKGYPGPRHVLYALYDRVWNLVCVLYVTVPEGMVEEQRRREEAERERDDLRRELFALRAPRESPQTVEEEPERAEPHSGPPVPLLLREFGWR
jgi:hypothetical protein